MRGYLLMILCLPCGAMAEDARQDFDCAVPTVCDGAGACREFDGTALVGIEAVNVGRDGSGEFVITYADVTAAVTAPTPVGPFVWSEGRNDRQTLLISGEDPAARTTTMLWQTFDETTRRSEIGFLVCKVTP